MENKLKILKKFEFSSTEGSMNVIVEEKENQNSVYIKGSPEKLHNLLDKNSIPKNFNEILKSYTVKVKK